jgi:hypothetical protein
MLPAIPLIVNLFGNNIYASPAVIMVNRLYASLLLTWGVLTILLIVKMFQQKIWARNVYIGLMVMGCYFNLRDGNYFILFIVAAVHFFVFYKCWDDFY